jgi:hypothetical protein
MYFIPTHTYRDGNTSEYLAFFAVFPLITKPVFSKNDCMGAVIQACFAGKKQFGSYFCNIKAG